ncbi:hypothetical protein [Salmonella enterica]|uniref:hypothetical protein n=1 Tax=Salmonella enterica TaxID=28901 RepID=UPI0021C3B56F|nr:hypothetical protein [Salmonella enterica]
MTRWPAVDPRRIRRSLRGGADFAPRAGGVDGLPDGHTDPADGGRAEAGAGWFGGLASAAGI